MSPIIQPEELLKLKPEDFILFDASAGSKARYDEKHLAGAFYVDLDKDLADIQDFANGGRHPLPSPNEFCNLLGNLGVDKNTHVIIYDDKNASNAAARFWWMLKAIGHEKVQVLNGGLNAALKAGFPIADGQEKALSKTEYINNGETNPNWQLLLVDINEVDEASKTGKQTIVDVRSTERFDGLTEPIDLIAGHIPGATNLPFTENLTNEGLFLPSNVLREKFEKAFGDLSAQQIIVHCGSGVTACHLLLAMDYAGLEIPKLYVGSWSEWSRNGKPMVLKQD